MVITVPPVVERLLTADVAVEIAEVFTDNVIYPDRIVVDGPASGRPGQGRRFPGWPGPVLVLSDENQGVCSWGVPLGGDRCPVLVSGELLDADEATVRYAPARREPTLTAHAPVGNAAIQPEPRLSGVYGAGCSARWVRSWHAWRTGTPILLAAARM